MPKAWKTTSHLPSIQFLGRARRAGLVSLVGVMSMAGACSDDTGLDDGGVTSSSSEAETNDSLTESSDAESTDATDATEATEATDATDDSETTGEACLDDPTPGLEGDAMALSEFEFKNAFDPTDDTTYDPDDAGALPGPIMVDAWGDRSAGAHGTLAVFPPGFSAPLHTHSDAYSGVVLRGEMSNPFGTELAPFLDGDATNDHGAIRLERGSFWHVPAGSQHTTTCVGPEPCWFYFYADAAFDFAPIVDGMGQLMPGLMLEDVPADARQTPAADLEYAGEPGSFVTFATAEGDFGAGPHGSFGRFDAGAVAPVHVHGADYYAVVIGGEMSNPFNLDASPPALDRGGFWSVAADAVHTTACAEGETCDFFFHSPGGFDFEPLCEQP